VSPVSASTWKHVGRASPGPFGKALASSHGAMSGSDSKDEDKDTTKDAFDAFDAFYWDSVTGVVLEMAAGSSDERQDQWRSEERMIK